MSRHNRVHAHMDVYVLRDKQMFMQQQKPYVHGNSSSSTVSEVKDGNTNNQWSVDANILSFESLRCGC